MTVVLYNGLLCPGRIRDRDTVRDKLRDRDRVRVRDRDRVRDRARFDESSNKCA